MSDAELAAAFRKVDAILEQWRRGEIGTGTLLWLLTPIGQRVFGEQIPLAPDMEKR